MICTLIFLYGKKIAAILKLPPRLFGFEVRFVTASYYRVPIPRLWANQNGPVRIFTSPFGLRLGQEYDVAKTYDYLAICLRFCHLLYPQFYLADRQLFAEIQRGLLTV